MISSQSFGEPMSRSPHSIEFEKVRSEAGLTHDQVAEMLGVTPRTIFRYESGESRPSPIAIKWIREAKGVAVLAHPTWIKDDGDGLRGCVTALKEAGLDGVEAHYSTHSKSQTSRYLELAQRLNLLVTGGSDFHGITKPDIEVGYGRGDLKVNPRLLEPLKSVAAGR